MANLGLGKRRRGRGGVSSPLIGAIALVLLAVGVLVMSAQRAGGRSTLEGARHFGDQVVAVVGGAIAAPFRAAGSFFTRFGHAWNEAKRIPELEREVRELHRWKDMAFAMSERLERYETLLKMPAEPLAQGLAARIIVETETPFSHTALANAGARLGVGAGDVAVNERGLVGRVVTVGKETSRLMLVTDFNSRVPVMGEFTRVRALIEGDGTSAPSLMYASDPAALRDGERLVTSGDGGVFPRGLPVGIARAQPNGGWRVVLSIAGAPIDFVRLLPFAAPPQLSTGVTPAQLPQAPAGDPATRTPNLGPLIATPVPVLPPSNVRTPAPAGNVPPLRLPSSAPTAAQNGAAAAPAASVVEDDSTPRPELVVPGQNGAGGSTNARTTN